LFNEGFRTLPAIFGINETVKGYVPLHFKTPETPKSRGVIPHIKHFGIDNMKVEDVSDFSTW
jgi:hypothetical protein